MPDGNSVPRYSARTPRKLFLCPPRFTQGSSRRRCALRSSRVFSMCSAIGVYIGPLYPGTWFLVATVGIEPTTHALSRRYSTTELRGQILHGRCNVNTSMPRLRLLSTVEAQVEATKIFDQRRQECWCEGDCKRLKECLLDAAISLIHSEDSHDKDVAEALFELLNRL